MPTSARAARRQARLSFEELLHVVFFWNHILLPGALDGDLEVAPVRIQPVRQVGWITGRLLALEQQAIDLVRGRLRHRVLDPDQVVELDRAVLLAPLLARRL